MVNRTHVEYLRHRFQAAPFTLHTSHACHWYISNPHLQCPSLLASIALPPLTIFSFGGGAHHDRKSAPFVPRKPVLAFVRHIIQLFWPRNHTLRPSAHPQVLLVRTYMTVRWRECSSTVFCLFGELKVLKRREMMELSTCALDSVQVSGTLAIFLTLSGFGILFGPG